PVLEFRLLRPDLTFLSRSGINHHPDLLLVWIPHVIGADVENGIGRQIETRKLENHAYAEFL
ncbi:MAG: hypothetical protein ACJAY2_003468, partial [Pseudomonadales bacterium]